MKTSDFQSKSSDGALQRSLNQARAAAVRGTRRPQVSGSDGLLRENFSLPRDEARAKAREWLNAYPKAAYWSRVEHWRKLPDGAIEFTMVRLPTAD